MKCFLFALLSCLLFVTPTHAEKNADLKPKSTERDSIVVDDNFERDSLGDLYTLTKGDWKIVDGVLVGKELQSDEHAAVLTLKQKNRNSVLQFSFMLDGSNGLMLSLNHAKGHLFRVTVAPNSLTLRTDKDKKDPTSKPILLAQANGRIQKGQWHTLLIEIKGEKVTVQLNNGLSVSGSHPSLDVDKPSYRFVMRGEALKLDDIKSWTVTE